MLNLAFLKKDNGVDIDFDPELVMISLNSGKSASIRVASGDENNINKNLKVDLTDVSEFSLHIDGFNEYQQQTTSLSDKDQAREICGVASLKLKKIDSEDYTYIQLAEHRINVFPKKTKEGKKTTYVFPEADAVQYEIDAIWKDVFADALSDFMLADAEGAPAARSRKSNTSDGLSLVTKICIGLIAASLLVAAFGYFNKRNNVQSKGQETITGVYDEISRMPESPPTQDVETSPDQEAMQEFGLEEGIKLE